MRYLLPFLLLLLLGAPPRSSAEPVQATGTLRLAFVGPIETLDPPKCSSESARAAVANLFDTLYEYQHLKRPYELAPCLAQSLPEVSEDRKTHTIRIRPGVRFLDDPCFAGKAGREVKTPDVIFCIKRMMDAHTKSPGSWMLAGKVVGLDAFVKASAKVSADPRRQAYTESAGYPEVAGLEAFDAHTLKIHLTRPMAELPWILAAPWFSIYAPESVRFYGAQLGTRAIGTGPYRVIMFLNGKKLVLRANRHYRKELFPDPDPDEDELEEGAAGSRLPRNDKVEITAYDNPLEAWQAFLNGDVDLAEVPRDAFDAAVDPHTSGPLPFLQKRGVAIYRNPRLEIFYDAFNHEDPVVGRPNGEKGRAIRRAICLVADDQWAIARLYTNRSERVWGPILPEFRGFDPGFINEWTRQDDEPRAEAVALARKTLAQAGLEGGKGIPVLRMHILEGAMPKRMFEILKTQVAEIGIRIESTVVAWPAMQDLLRQKKAQMWTSSWYADYPDAQNFLQLFYGPNSPEPNYSNYFSKSFDTLYEEARSLPPTEDPADIYDELQNVVMEDCPWRFRLRRIRWTARHGWLRGYRYNDLVAKFFKYCAVDDEARTRAIGAWK